MNKWMAVILGMGLIPFPARAQSPPAEGPVLQMAPPGSEWNMTIRQENGPQSPPAPTPASVHPTALRMRTGRNAVQHGTITFSNGNRKDFYVVDGQVLQKYDNSEKIAIFPEEFPGIQALRRRDWPGLFWLAQAGTPEREMVGKTECFHFHQTGLAGSDLPADFVFSAWIRTDTGHPLRVRLGAATYEFSEVTPFSGDVNLPANFQAAWKAFQTRLRVLKRLNSHR